MRVEIQFWELKIQALEKSCEFDISAITKSDLGLKDVSIKGGGKQILSQAPQNIDSLSPVRHMTRFI